MRRMVLRARRAASCLQALPCLRLSRPCEILKQEKSASVVSVYCVPSIYCIQLSGGVPVHLKSWLLHLVVALAFGGMTTASHATPMHSAAAQIANQAPSPHSIGVQSVAGRSCWRRHGRLHCTSRARSRRTSEYYERDANALPFGTSRWWEQMLRENRAGNPGGGGRN